MRLQRKQLLNAYLLGLAFFVLSVIFDRTIDVPFFALATFCLMFLLLVAFIVLFINIVISHEKGKYAHLFLLCIFTVITIITIPMQSRLGIELNYYFHPDDKFIYDTKIHCEHFDFAGGPLGNLTENKILSYDYYQYLDSAGNVLKEVFDESTTLYFYDDNGNLIEKRDCRGHNCESYQSKIYVYDRNNNLIRVGGKYARDSAHLWWERYTYDEDNRLIIEERDRSRINKTMHFYTQSERDSSHYFHSDTLIAREIYYYDEAGLMINSTKSFVNSSSLHFNYYDNWGRLIRTLEDLDIYDIEYIRKWDSAGNLLEYYVRFFDKDGNLDTLITSSGQFWSTSIYDSAGRCIENRRYSHYGGKLLKRYIVSYTVVD